jgi:uncharacterized protein (TIGR03067 family)
MVLKATAPAPTIGPGGTSPAPEAPFMRIASLVLLVVVPFAIADAADSFDGTWVPVEAEIGGKSLPDKVRETIKLEIKGDKYTVTAGDSVDKGTFKLNAKAKPATLDITSTEGPNKGKTILAIYEVKGDTLKVCYDLGGKERPKALKGGEGLFLATYKRKKT